MSLMAWRRRRASCPRRRAIGFTLIEVMVALAIVGILTAIALPAYRDYVLRGQLVAATNALSADRALMEQYYQDNRTYVGGPCSATPAQTVGSSSSAQFSVSCPTTSTMKPTASTYTIVATGSGAVAGFGFSIDQDGNMTTTSLPAAWGALPNPDTCWVMSKGQTC